MNAGFSLLEVLVALALSAMIAVAGGAVLHQTLLAGDAAEVSAARSQSLASAYTLIRRDFTAAVASGPIGSESSAKSLEVERNQKGWRAAFVAGGFDNPGEAFARGDVQYIEYACEDGTFVRSVWPSALPQTDEPALREDLLSGLEACSLKVAAGSELRDIPASRTRLDARLIELQFDRGGRGVVSILVGARG
jgi:general secretion pathway protein J